MGASERSTVALVGLIQFVCILEFMIVMPLGPDFARDLGLAVHRVGWIGSAYTFAAALAGIAGGFFLDRFDRRKALAVTLSGLVAGTAAGGLAHGIEALLLARVLAGAFGGPTAALSLSVLADVVPPERRGRAMGAVMAAFSVASVLGVPAGLELARLSSWRVAFFAVAGLGTAISIAVVLLLPPMRRHLDEKRPEVPGPPITRNPAALASLAAYATQTISAFLIIPNISALMQTAYGVPRSRLGLLYATGGILAFAVTRPVGRAVDRFGAAAVAVAGTAFYLLVLYAGYIHPPFLPGIVVFAAFMLAMPLRNIPMVSLATRVPPAHQRARFMSTQSATQHLSNSLAAFFGSLLLTTSADGHLVGMARLGWIAVAFGGALPFLLLAVERRVRARETAERSAAA